MPSAAPSPKKPTAPSTRASKAAGEYDTYLSSSEPVETRSAPVWVVPGILLVLTSMLALLGGILGRNDHAAPAARAEALPATAAAPVPGQSPPRRRPRPRPEDHS